MPGEIRVDTIKSNSGFGTVTFSSTGPIVTGILTVTSSGSASAPAITPQGDSNTGIFFPAADTTAFSQGGVEAARLDSSGILGIGTTNPSKHGGTVVAYSSGTGVVRAVGSAVTSYLFSSPGGGLAAVGTESNHPFSFYVNNAEAARIDTSKRLLVGLTTARTLADAQHTVQVETTNYAALSLVNNTNDTGGCNFSLGKSRGTSAGGTTIVQSGDTLGAINFVGANGTNLSSYGAQISAVVDATPGASDMPGRIVLSTTADGASSPTERMRIDNAGIVMIGGTATEPGDNNTSTGISFKSTAKFYLSQAADGGHMNRNSDGAIIHFRRSGTQVGDISVTTTATSYATSSDYRLKENVTAVTDGIARLQQLKPSRFNFIADPSKTVDGFIAHEVQIVVPEAITGEKDAVDDDGNPVYQGIDQSKLVPLLAAALQEAIGEIESLKARVAALESA